MEAEVFISYSRRDAPRVTSLVHQLRAAGISVWIDVEGIDGAVLWRQAIVEAIEGCKAVILMVSPTSMASEQVARELTLANDERKGILPLALEPVEIPSSMRWQLAGLQRIELFHADQGDRMEEILRALAHFDVLPRAPATPAASEDEIFLPIPRTRFIGREREIAAVKEQLAGGALVTLTGPGGAGKTRLALEVAQSLGKQFPDGVRLAELAALTEVALVPQAVATALGVAEEPGRPLAVTLANHLKPKQVLLVVDNCEHLIEACAQLVHALLGQCPKLQILATRRQVLAVSGERVFSVPSLTLPPEDPLLPVERLAEYEAVRLFVNRAEQVMPRFTLTPQNAQAVAQICRQLDGISLAIELAAARVKVLTPEQIAARLDDRFRLLTGGSREALPRQKTLQGLIDWSYDLLGEPEQILWQRLSIFAGGFTVEAAEAVCAGDGIEDFEVLDLLGELVDKSLVVAETHGMEARCRMLETLRQYGRRKLEDGDGAAVPRERHCAWYLELAERAEPELRGADQSVWLKRLDREQENLRTALVSGLEAGAVEPALRLGAAFWRFWSMRGHPTEGRERLAAALALPGAEERTSIRARALHGAANLAQDQGDYGAARALYEESLDIQRELDDMPGMANALHNLGTLAREQGDYVAARSLLEQSLAIAREMDDQDGIGMTLLNLGTVAQHQGDYEAARALYEESLAIQRQRGEQWSTAILLNNLGHVAMLQSDYDAARSLFEQSLAGLQELGDRSGAAQVLGNLGLVAQLQGDHARAVSLHRESLRRFQEMGSKREIAGCFEHLAGLAVAQEQLPRAARLCGAAEALRETIGAPRPPGDGPEYERWVAAIRAALDEAQLATAWALGRAMTLDQAIDFALEVTEEVSDAEPADYAPVQ